MSMRDRDSGDTMWAQACALIERAERLQRQCFSPGVPRGPQANWEPPVDIFETDRDILVVAVLPGVELPDLDVHIDGSELVLRGLRRLPKIGHGTAILRLEAPYGLFERRIALSGGMFRLERCDLANGCLSLVLAKQL